MSPIRISMVSCDNIGVENLFHMIHRKADGVLVTIYLRRLARIKSEFGTLFTYGIRLYNQTSLNCSTFPVNTQTKISISNNIRRYIIYTSMKIKWNA
jgi:hypothetical protein